MNTEQVIERLAADHRRVRRGARPRRLAIGLVTGSIVTLLLVAFGLGVRPDLGLAMHGFSLWMKWSYTVSLGIGAVLLTARLGRPEPVRLARYWPALLPFALLALVSAVEMASMPARDRLAMWLGESWMVCPWLVLGLSAPIFVGLLWSFRRLAPTRLRAAGSAAGFAAGAWAAAFYCIHCPEMSATFVLTWYTLGVVLAAGAGALLGPRLLRW